MRLQDIMTRPVSTVSASNAADDAWNTMRSKGIRHLVVTDGNRIVGIVSDRDMGGRNGAAVRGRSTVRDLMTPRVVTAAPTTTVRQAANLMRGRSIGCLVVARGSGAVGIVTVADLLELIGRGSERPVAETARWTLKHRTPHRKRHQDSGVW